MVRETIASGGHAAGFDVGEGIAVLERTPAVLRAWLTGLPEAWTRADEGADTWSPFDIVGHLIDGEETDWIPRARIILAQGPDRRFAPYDRFRHLGDRATATLAERLERFTALRAGNVSTLRGWSLTPEQLALTGVHPEFGEVTLAQLLATWVAHDLDHLMQIARIMGKRYTDAAGPWKAYLRVLRS
jgi:DinB family protein